jgi:hypothetical protein
MRNNWEDSWPSALVEVVGNAEAVRNRSTVNHGMKD